MKIFYCCFLAFVLSGCSTGIGNNLPEKKQTLMSDIPDLIKIPPIPLLEQMLPGLRPGVLNDSPIYVIKLQYICKDIKHKTNVRFTYWLYEAYNDHVITDGTTPTSLSIIPKGSASSDILCALQKSYVDVPLEEKDIQSTDRFSCRKEAAKAIATRHSEGYNCLSRIFYVGVIGRSYFIRIL